MIPNNLNPQQHQDNTIIKGPQLVAQPPLLNQQLNPGIPNAATPNFLQPISQVPPFMGNNGVQLITPPPMSQGLAPPPLTPQSQNPMASIPILNTLNPIQQNQPKQTTTRDQWKKLWIGNLPEELPDEDIQSLLNHCGEVVSWKRTKDQKGKFAKFGFVEFNHVESVVKCIRLIQDFEITQGHHLKVKPSEQTQQFLDQWKELKKNEWNVKNQDQKMGYNNFEEFLQKDDQQFYSEIKALMESIQIKLEVLRKEIEREDEKREHIREKDRASKKRSYRKRKDEDADEKIYDWERHEDEKKRRKRKEKERQLDKKQQLKEKLQKELSMDSDDERKFISYKYKHPKRKQFRREEYLDDEEEKQREIARQAPPEPTVPQSLVPTHTEDMEIEEKQQPPQQYQSSFKQVEEIIINPERQKMIDTNTGGLPQSNQKYQLHQDQQQQQQNVKGFDQIDDEEEKQAKQTMTLNLPNTIQQTKLQQEQQRAQEIRQEEIKKQKQEEHLKKQLQQLIKEIPKEKEDLFAYQIDWTFLAKSDIIQTKVQPWLNQKSKEYLNEVEINFVKMIIKKLNNAASAEDIYKKVKFILEEDAEQFVIKLWRMLIFEILKVKSGLMA